VYKRITGIYWIRNLINNKVYIGSAVCLTSRKNGHKRNLMRNKHPNKHLQLSVNKYGYKNFIFEIIEKLENNEKLLEREQYWLDLYKSYDREKGYNYRKIAQSNLGLKLNFTKETYKNKIDKMSGENNHFFGKQHTEESKKKISERRTGVRPCNFSEWRDKLSKNATSKKGVNNSSAKLNQQLADEIRVKYADKKLKHSHNTLAKEYGVSPYCIQSILEYKTWAGRIVLRKVTIILSEEQEIIKNLYLTENITQKQLAKKYNVSVRTIQSVLNGH